MYIPIINVSYVLCRIGCLRTFHANEMDHSNSEVGVLAIFNEFAKVRESTVFHFRVFVDDLHDGVSDASFVSQTSFVSEHGR